MKNFLIIPFLVFQLFKLQAQGEIVILDPKVNPGRVLKEYPLPSSTLKGSNYISDQWNLGNLYLKSGEVAQNYLLKYDISNAFLEIKVDETIKVCYLKDILKFEWQPPGHLSNEDIIQFINCDQFKFKETPIIGIFEVLFSDKLDLLVKYRTEVLKGTYVEGLDMGEPNDKIVRKEEYYCNIDNSVYRISKDKNENLLLFGTKRPDIENYITKNRMKFGRKEDLIKIFTHYNDLLKHN